MKAFNMILCLVALVISTSLPLLLFVSYLESFNSFPLYICAWILIGIWGLLISEWLLMTIYKSLQEALEPHREYKKRDFKK